MFPNCQYWSSATLSPSLEIYASTMYIAGIYTLSFSFVFPVLLTDYMYITIIISWGTLCTTQLHHSRTLTQHLTQSKTGDPLWTNFTSREKQLCTQHVQVFDLAYQCWSRLIELTICNGSGLPVQKLLSLPIFFGASKTFSLHCPL